MKYLFYFSICLFLTLRANAQRIYSNVFVGVTNYQGDLQQKIFEVKNAKPVIGASISYLLLDNIAIRSGLNFAVVSADDIYNSERNKSRNLNFTSNIYEGYLGAEYYLKSLHNYYFTPYIFAGLAFYHFNPVTKDSAGVKQYLAGLNTEGQGFTPGKLKYNLFQFCIPFGGGIKYSVNENFHLGIEFGIRKLFTDYLDDVSGTYVDKSILLANRGAKAVELAYRGKGAYPAAGSPRGSSAKKDWYYFLGITTAFKMFRGNKQVKMIGY